jgi:hypothetical protein
MIAHGWSEAYTDLGFTQQTGGPLSATQQAGKRVRYATAVSLNNASRPRMGHQQKPSIPEQRPARHERGNVTPQYQRREKRGNDPDTGAYARGSGYAD